MRKTHSENKSQVENSHKQFELRHVPFTSINICYK